MEGSWEMNVETNHAESRTVPQFNMTNLVGGCNDLVGIQHWQRDARRKHTLQKACALL